MLFCPYWVERQPHGVNQNTVGISSEYSWFSSLVPLWSIKSAWLGMKWLKIMYLLNDDPPTGVQSVPLRKYDSDIVLWSPVSWERRNLFTSWGLTCPHEMLAVTLLQPSKGLRVLVTNPIISGPLSDFLPHKQTRQEGGLNIVWYLVVISFNSWNPSLNTFQHSDPDWRLLKICLEDAVVTWTALRNVFILSGNWPKGIQNNLTEGTGKKYFDSLS